MVYYFPTKIDLVAAVLDHATARLLEALTGALGGDTKGFREVLGRSWIALRAPELTPAVRLYVEAVGLAAGGREPYRSVVTRLADSWLPWFAGHLATTRGNLDEHAAALVAALDGLLVLRVTAGPEVAAAAARGLDLELVEPDPRTEP